jgi:DNA repair exonuclease SbcCD ATPase subunit
MDLIETLQSENEELKNVIKNLDVQKLYLDNEYVKGLKDKYEFGTKSLLLEKEVQSLKQEITKKDAKIDELIKAQHTSTNVRDGIVQE